MPSPNSGPPQTGFDTLMLHAGQRPDPTTGARATPIFQTASFVFANTDEAVGLFNIERAGHVYSRLSNPTNAVLEERIAALEGGVAAIATASGQAATHLLVTTLCSSGDHVVSSGSVYGGTHNLFAYTLPRMGIETTFVDPRSPQEFADAIQPNTKLLFGESIGNPGLEVLDVPSVAEVAHAADLPLAVDSTFSTPYLFRPFEWGADIVVHSATKFLSGHGVVIGGLVVDSGRFDWLQGRKHSTMVDSYDGFHDLVFAEEFGPLAFITRARKEGLRDFGACMSPTTAFQVLQGMETLSMRMDRHVSNARKVVDFLVDHDAVESVVFPELESHPDQALAARLMPRGASAIIAVNVKGGRSAGQKLIEATSVFSHLANVGDAKSLIIHPASTTHHRMSEESLRQAGIGEGLVRLSIGLEDADDLIADLSRGLRASQRDRS